MNAACGRTLIRKTSLLRKINPMMRRSSFTNKDIYKQGHLQLDHLAMNERRNVPEIVIAIPRIASQIPNSDQSPLYDVRNPATRVPKDNACEVMFSRTVYSRPVGNQLSARLRPSGYAGHASLSALEWLRHA